MVLDILLKRKLTQVLLMKPSFYTFFLCERKSKPQSLTVLCHFCQVFSGNINHTLVTHALSPKIRHTRYIRFVVITWYKVINLRVEVYGCKE